ncbi:epoxide hydrolase 4-like [Schistocerca gregaria]|uniref:epoxide hydrolase 4-like n=1 Tax=Schistocerca gregaria TaxID=7010 RepID=UPI00211E3CAF|nr:epoxide hydrolase 4-like [Schistocerca gregaria]
MDFVTLLTRVAILLTACVYGALFLARNVWRWLKNPTNFFWRVAKRPTPPAVLSDPALGEHRYAQLKDLKIHYVEKGDKSHPLMLFVHGYPEFWYSWRHQIKEFSRDYWTVAMDMRGFGDSDKPEGKQNYKIDLLVEDIRNLVQALGREKFTLVAHDWGGVVGWAFVFKYYHMLNNYIILDAPFPDAWSNMVFSDKDQFLKSWYVFFYQLPFLPELALRLDDFGIFDTIFRMYAKVPIKKEEIEAYKYTFGKPGALTPPVNYYRALMEAPWHQPSPPRGKPLPPGLFLFGEKEFALSFDFLSHARDQIGVPTAIVKEAGHFVQQENPEEVNRLIRDFLSSQEAR